MLEIELFRHEAYPLGYIAQIFFCYRFFYQWIESERRKESFVDLTFWRFSFIASSLFSLHSLIQSQYPVFIAQVMSAFVAYRLYTLMKGTASIGGRNALYLFIFTLTAATFIFGTIASFTDTSWFRSPSDIILPPIAHAFGMMSIFLFSSRFVVQWYLVEKGNGHALHPAFWYLSLLGAYASLGYFLMLRDPVNILGALFSTIPFMRNLFLLNKKKESI